MMFHFFLEPSVRGWKRGKEAGRRVAARVKKKRR
jgi:hypothetical protein